MKHGPAELIDENMPVVCVAPMDRVYAKVVSNMQPLAYHIAVLRGCDVDRPRNLAKSVTVE